MFMPVKMLLSALIYKTITLTDLDFNTAWKQTPGHSVTEVLTVRAEIT